jgi:dGTPase
LTLNQSDVSLTIMIIREQLEKKENEFLSAYAAKSAQSRGRKKPETECDLRPAYQHDRDRIIHSKAFRRLKHKSQVFLSPSGDHYRTRLTHTLEVSQIARTIARSLFLNEDLTEAIALGHDLGHTPFGHSGEKVLNEIVDGGFRHYEQSLRVVDIIEDLNLTWEVRDGIVNHSKGQGIILPETQEDGLPGTLEGRIVRLADITAYICHDIDDAVRAGVLKIDDLPENCVRKTGETHSQRIGSMVRDIIETSMKSGGSDILMSENLAEVLKELRAFMYERVYGNPEVKNDFGRARKILAALFAAIMENPESDHFSKSLIIQPDEDLMRAVVDFIAGMTDRYALSLYEKLFMPRPWAVL